MLNPPVSNVPPWKDFFWTTRSAYRRKNCLFSPFFPSHRRTLWDRNFSLEYVKSPCLKFPPLKGFFFRTTRSAYRSRNVVPQSPPRRFPQGSEFKRPRIKKVVKTKLESLELWRKGRWNFYDILINMEDTASESKKKGGNPFWGLFRFFSSLLSEAVSSMFIKIS